uniref:Ion transport domain-containing protein n=1 Tax=Timema poppense TaxID=170557 RepID=A0A7R9CX70_TIMPO|nr:unnamed protein product [Timema poppensis]
MPALHHLSSLVAGSVQHATCIITERSTPHSGEDVPNEIGSTASLNNDLSENSVELTPAGEMFDAGQHWEMNYHEAAIFLEVLEGENNEKFDSHPHNSAALPAYLLVHNRWYYGLDMATSIILLTLAFVEEPALPLFKLPVAVHGSIELLALIIIGVELTMKLRWIGWRTILKHKRTMTKGITLGIMFVEAVTVLVRQSSHFRVTRALRPIFLVDTCHCGGVRRFIRQIFQSLPPILDMLGLLMFFISIYALLGYYLFSGEPRTEHFNTLHDSFVSMFVLLTTANFPDVMMPLYAKSKWYSVFFISYLCIVLYILMNLMLAVVYETFTRIEREKFRKLLLHKRKACQHAYRLLVSKQNPNKIRFKQFEGLMRYFAPKKNPSWDLVMKALCFEDSGVKGLFSVNILLTDLFNNSDSNDGNAVCDVILMFKELNTSDSGSLSLEEFYAVYDATLLKWEAQFSHIPWFHTTWIPLQTLCQWAHDFVIWPYFEHLIVLRSTAEDGEIEVRISVGTPYFLGNTVSYIPSHNLIRDQRDVKNPGISSKHIVAGVVGKDVYAVEAMLRVLGMGLTQYFNSGWNVYDFSVTLGTFLGVIILYMAPWFVYVVVLRPLRLLRLFKLKKRYRDVFGTLVLLTPLMCSTAIVMLVMYYFFSIIGMELFAGYDMRNCCVNTTVEDFYKWSSNSTTALGYYYLNTFDDLMTSGVTLFELTIVNNWFILMNSYAVMVSPWSRGYFMLFYLFTMVVLTIVVASVLEAFRFRIQYKRQTTKREEEKMLHEEVHLKWEEMQSWVQDFQLLERLRADLIVGLQKVEAKVEVEGQISFGFNFDVYNNLRIGTATFIGCRPRNREVLQRRMYRTEIEEWMKEADMAERHQLSEHTTLDKTKQTLIATRTINTTDLPNCTNSTSGWLYNTPGRPTETTRTNQTTVQTVLRDAPIQTLNNNSRPPPLVSDWKEDRQCPSSEPVALEYWACRSPPRLQGKNSLHEGTGGQPCSIGRDTHRSASEENISSLKDRWPCSIGRGTHHSASEENLSTRRNRLNIRLYVRQVQAQVSFSVNVQLISLFCEELDNRTKHVDGNEMRNSLRASFLPQSTVSESECQGSSRHGIIGAREAVAELLRPTCELNLGEMAFQLSLVRGENTL